MPFYPNAEYIATSFFVHKIIVIIKDDTLPCKRQALAWQKELKAWTQALQRYKQFFYQSGA